MVTVFRKSALPIPAEVPQRVHEAAQTAASISLREPRPVGFPLFFTDSMEIVEPVVAFLHEHAIHRAHTADTEALICPRFIQIERLQPPRDLPSAWRSQTEQGRRPRTSRRNNLRTLSIGRGIPQRGLSISPKNYCRVAPATRARLSYAGTMGVVRRQDQSSGTSGSGFEAGSPGRSLLRRLPRDPRPA